MDQLDTDLVGAVGGELNALWLGNQVARAEVAALGEVGVEHRLYAPSSRKPVERPAEDGGVRVIDGEGRQCRSIGNGDRGDRLQLVEKRRVHWLAVRPAIAVGHEEEHQPAAADRCRRADLRAVLRCFQRDLD